MLQQESERERVSEEDQGSREREEKKESGGEGEAKRSGYCFPVAFSLPNDD